MLAVIENKPLKITFKSNTVSGYIVEITNTHLRDKSKDCPNVMQMGTSGSEYNFQRRRHTQIVKVLYLNLKQVRQKGNEVLWAARYRWSTEQIRE